MTDHAIAVRSAAPRSRWLAAALDTDATLAPVLLRLVLAAVMFPHGAQKAFGWFGGHGFSGTMDFLTQQIGLPWVAAALVILLELAGPLLLLVGLGTRLVALGLAVLMAGAIATVHLQFGFFMNWSGTAAGEGYEFHLLAIGIALALVLTGGGRWSSDGRIARALGSR